MSVCMLTVSVADGIFQPGPGGLKYELWSNASLKINVLIEDRIYMLIF